MSRSILFQWSIFALMVCVLLSGCEAYKAVDTSMATYKKSSVNLSGLENGQIALLPMLAGNELEAFRRSTGDKLHQAFVTRYGASKIVGPQESLDLINQANLTDQYAKLLDVYEKSGILNKSVLRDLGDALQSRYLVFSRLNDFKQNSSVVKGDLSTRDFSIYIQNWDTQKGDIIWEGTGGATAAIDGTPESSWNHLIEIACLGAASRFDEDPMSQALIKGISSAYADNSSNYWAFLLGTLGIGGIVVLIAIMGL